MEVSGIQAESRLGVELYQGLAIREATLPRHVGREDLQRPREKSQTEGVFFLGVRGWSSVKTEPPGPQRKACQVLGLHSAYRSEAPPSACDEATSGLVCLALFLLRNTRPLTTSLLHQDGDRGHFGTTHCGQSVDIWYHCQPQQVGHFLSITIQIIQARALATSQVRQGPRLR